jgi:F-type H+-transporting ATPase subunit delta
VRTRDTELSATYAEAIYETALEDWLASLKAFEEALADDETIAASLKDATLELAQRQDVARKALPPGASEEVFNFVSLLISKNHLHLLGDVIVQLEHLARRGPRPRVARVTTAVPLGEEEREQVEDALVDRFGGGLEFEFVVDESILGGLVARVGDEIVDDSVASKLAALRESVLAAE